MGLDRDGLKEEGKKRRFSFSKTFNLGGFIFVFVFLGLFRYQFSLSRFTILLSHFLPIHTYIPSPFSPPNQKIRITYASELREIFLMTIIFILCFIGQSGI